MPRPAGRAKPPRVRPLDRALAVAGALALLILHLDFWRGPRPTLLFGAIPEELAYRLGWMLAAAAYLWFFTARVWTDEDER